METDMKSTRQLLRVSYLGDNGFKLTIRKKPLPTSFSSAAVKVLTIKRNTNEGQGNEGR